MSDCAPSTRVVVADDDGAMQALLVRQLEKAGYTVAACGDGLEALELVKHAGSCIVVADWTMPGMDGVELCRTVRELSELRVVGMVYFVLLTAHQEKSAIITGLEAGANDYLTKPYHQAELLARIRAGERLLRLQDELVERQVDMQKISSQMAILNRKLERLANTDGLTGLVNRRYTLEALQRLWDKSLESGAPLSVVMLDIDSFKKINDTYGHKAGDTVLIAVAAALRRQARGSDVCGRVGGEEFLILLPASDLNQAAAAAERVRRAIQARLIDVGAASLEVTASVGVAQRGPHCATPDELVCTADRMLYHAKEAGRNQVWVAEGVDQGRRVELPESQFIGDFDSAADSDATVATATRTLPDGRVVRERRAGAR
ncbi:MAG: diguanylate cyclase [Phycisphaerae bacterium]